MPNRKPNTKVLSHALRKAIDRLDASTEKSTKTTTFSDQYAPEVVAQCANEREAAYADLTKKVLRLERRLVAKQLALAKLHQAYTELESFHSDPEA